MNAEFFDRAGGKFWDLILGFGFLLSRSPGGRGSCPEGTDEVEAYNTSLHDRKRLTAMDAACSDVREV